MKSEWTYRPLGELVSFASGGTPSKKRDDYWGGTIPWISAKTLKTENIDTSDLFITEEGLKAGSKIAPKGSILLLTRGSGLFNGIPIARVEKDVAFNQDIKCLDSYGEVENEFIFYWLLSQKDYLMAKVGVTGIGAGKFDLDFLQKLMIPIPSERERKSIVGFASSISEKIRCNAKVNDNLYDLVNTLYTKLFKDTDCEMTTVEDYVDCIYSGGTPATSNMAYWNGNLNWLSSGETRNRFMISTEKTITQLGADNSSTKSAQKYDIVIASAGQGFTRGQTSMLLLNTYINQSVIVLHAKKTVLPYLFWNLTNRYDDLRAISDSSSIRGSLTTKMLSKLKIPKVEDSLILKFSEFAWSIIPQIENNLIENKRLTDLRDSLLPKLMSGEIDVSDIQL